MLLKEAEKPKEKQDVTADLFLEIYKSVNVIQSYQPKVFEEIKKDEYVDVLVNKYKDGVVTNVVKFRDLSKIARAELTGENPAIAIPVLTKIASNKEYTIEKAYRDTVESAYEVRSLRSKIENIKNELNEYVGPSDVPEEIIEILKELKEIVSRLLGKA